MCVLWDWSRRYMTSDISSIDWNLFIFCRNDTTEKLINPTKESYRSTEKHFIGFKIARVFLSSLKIDKLNYGSEIASTLTKNGAKWLKNCFAKNNQQMLNRAGKRQHDETEKDHTMRMGKLLRKRPLFSTLENLDIFEEDLHTSLIHVFRKML